MVPALGWNNRMKSDVWSLPVFSAPLCAPRALTEVGLFLVKYVNGLGFGIVVILARACGAG